MTNQTATTDAQNEQLTQVDANNNVIGPISRGIAHNTAGIYYRTIFVLIKNDRNEILLQKRSSTKDLYPNCWDLSVGGHVNFGKGYIETAAREVEEEMGIHVEGKDLIFKGEVLVKLPKSNEFFHVFEYKLKEDQIISTGKEEVSSTQWMSVENIKKSMKEKTLDWYERPLQVVAALY